MPSPCTAGGVWLLTLHGEEHGLADVGAHAVAGLAEVVADVLLQHVADEQRAVGQDLDAARQRDGVVLLGVAAPWQGTRGHGAQPGQSRAGGSVPGWPCQRGCSHPHGGPRVSPLACFHMTFGGGYPSTEQFSTPALP